MPTIYVGGWARFREESGVTKKEPMEEFSWMGSAASDYEDCRDALARVKGAREYIKTYVAAEEGINFNDPLGMQIELHSLHSGASATGMLWSYKNLLNHWDSWVLAQKERVAYQEYTKIQAKEGDITMLYWSSEQLMGGNRGRFPVDEDEFLQRAQKFGLQGGVQDFYPILKHLYLENMARMALQAQEQKKQQHAMLIDGLKWKYKHPIRWFDTPYGSTIMPTTPQFITPEALEEMEGLYPGYRKHIDRVRIAMAEFQLPQGTTRYSRAGEEFTKQFLTQAKIMV